MGSLHARNAALLEEAELVAVASTREVAAAVGLELGVPAASYDEVFATADVEAVVLAARSIDHAELACRVLRQASTCSSRSRARRRWPATTRCVRRPRHCRSSW
jgi:predicted dehydrogenase